MNEEMNKLDAYRNKKCFLCKRSYPETILNIEAVIHHSKRYECFDQKKCKRIRRKKS